MGEVAGTHVLLIQVILPFSHNASRHTSSPVSTLEAIPRTLYCDVLIFICTDFALVS